jgi:peptidoglycan/LPS O-acetylase OafA/YrhL
MATTSERGPGRAQKKSGRVTPSAKGGAAAGSVQSNRYTPPIDRSTKVSPKWLGIVIIAMFALGVLVVILNYANLLPGGVNNLWLVAAIGCIFVGLLLATRYH